MARVGPRLSLPKGAIQMGLVEGSLNLADNHALFLLKSEKASTPSMIQVGLVPEIRVAFIWHIINIIKLIIIYWSLCIKYKI